ncbi:hypothetical protein [Thioalkalivibrio sp. ALJT]|uniref:hypothetical protein n=1 Tax=Thioalkalivibrio sp. ALJT TaxID=1158146 RepID=UPI000363226E|nr:hypothetical protein [Thioalkalivibrio sp. ALJT]
MASFLLHGCAGLPIGGNGETQRAAPANCASDLGTEERLALQVAEEQAREGRWFAALAELDALGVEHDEVVLARGQILSRIGHADARDAFRQVKDEPCHRGPAHHGLGILALREANYALAEEHLHQARVAMPNMSVVRNDYGFVLMLLEKDEDAEFEFRTALELDAGRSQALENLMLLYLSRGETRSMDELVREYGANAEMVARLNERVERLEATRLEAQGRVILGQPLDGTAQAFELGIPNEGERR